MSSSPQSKKEIRLKVEAKLYDLLAQNASAFGVKPNDYIMYLILDDIKDHKAEQIPYISLESEHMVKAGYEEVADLKSKGKLKSMSASDLIKGIE